MSATKQTQNANYWRSFRQLHNDPAFQAVNRGEFNHGVDMPPDLDSHDKVSRRRFLGLMGAAAALAGTACSPYRDKGKIVPYVEGKDGLLPGVPNYYASTITFAGEAHGVLIKTREGRPIKINGNPEQPLSRGKIPAYVQAQILELYAPGRIDTPRRRRPSDLALYENVFEDSDWKTIDKDLIALFKEARDTNGEIALLLPEHVSPGRAAALANFAKKYPNLRVYTMPAMASQQRRSGWRQAFGSRPMRRTRFDKADIIISIDGDFLGTDKYHIRNIREFASRREVVKKVDFNRLYQFEAAFSQTGISADYRLRLQAGDEYALLLALAAELGIATGVASSNLKAFSQNNKWAEETIGNMLKDISEAGKKVLFYAGDQQPAHVHALVNLMNFRLSGDWHYAESEYYQASGSVEELSARLEADRVAVLVHADVNPVFDLPNGSDYAKAMGKAGKRVFFAMRSNESRPGSDFILPLSHACESWGDAFASTTVYALQQPVIQPLYASRQLEEALLHWAEWEAPVESTNERYYDFLRAYCRAEIYPRSGQQASFLQFWQQTLHDGFTTLDQAPEKELQLATGIALPEVTSRAALVLQIKPAYAHYDGSLANNGWLQETPHPVSKVTWDNYLAIAPSTAAELQVENNDRLNIQTQYGEITMPAFVQPGMATNSVVVECGYGRTAAGPVGDGVGFNVQVLRHSQSGWQLPISKLEKAGGTYTLASTQEHFVIDLEEKAAIIEKRHLIQHGTVAKYKKDPDFIQAKKYDVFSIVDEWPYEGNKWAMAIDLNKCIGCNACVTSCSIENNVPVVGKDQVIRGREMQWLRIDRYYSGTADEARAHLQPMLCQHCDNAPCENVCPVNATVHSPEGLNDMSYNRCVGTRYCANNCPYKVRRFNFYDYRDRFADAFYDSEEMMMLNNPEVTVRSRGVMEKCTFCTQRISWERDQARQAGRDVIGDNIVTACQEACPAEAIVFGDSNQPDGKLKPLREHKLGYHVLEEINVKPNVTYIAHLQNTQTEEQA
jgi:MoCo/4Fe-4S cofactor protein with predicted Tat translocation signal